MLWSWTDKLNGFYIYIISFAFYIEDSKTINIINEMPLTIQTFSMENNNKIYINIFNIILITSMPFLLFKGLNKKVMRQSILYIYIYGNTICIEHVTVTF